MYLNPVNKLCLGTAQFGSDYGIANKKGKVLKNEVFRILECAHKAGINTLDTAASYGESEIILGDYLTASGKGFNIVSKLSFPQDTAVSCPEELYRQSLGRLKGNRLYGYLIHKFDDLTRQEGLFSELKALRKKGLVYKIGFSLYNPRELDYIFRQDMDADIIQLPYSIFDRRFDRYFSILKSKNIEIHTRSVFLQGLFFLSKEEVRNKFSFVKEALHKLSDIAEEHDIPVNALCLCFALLNPNIDQVIIGVDSVEQLEQNIASFKYFERVNRIYGALEALQCNDEGVILPYRWMT